MSMHGTAVDDYDARPASVTSLLRTVIATYAPVLDGWIAIPHLIVLMEAVGVPAPRTRTALVRVKAKGLLVSQARDGVPGYAVVPQAEAMLRRAHQRVHHPRQMARGGRWCLISFSIPEEMRDRRHQLRRQLRHAGAGTVSGALWIAPDYVADEIDAILVDVGVREHCTLFMADEVLGVDDLPAAVAQWWDLDAIGSLHTTFLREYGDEVLRRWSREEPRDAFSIWIRALDRWRAIPYEDPGLPAELMPPDWPGREATPAFFAFRDEVVPRAAEYVRDVVGAVRDLPLHHEECPRDESLRIA